MVVQKTVDNLKGKSGEEKKAVASSIAVGVVIILLVGWGFMFVRKLQSGTQLDFKGAVPTEFNSDSMRAAQEALQNQMQYSTEELRAIRESAASGQEQTQVELQDGTGAPFGEEEGF